MNFNQHTAAALAQTIQSLYTHDTAPNVTCPETDTQVLVEKMAEGQFAVIFPGTASAQDWRTDSKIKKIEWFGHRVHRGFAQAYDSVHYGIDTIIPPNAAVIIAGHSLGGALATLAAIRLGLKHTISAVYTFGSPRVGNGPFARRYDALLHDNTFRLVNEGDPVPHVPWVLGTYRHVGTRVFLHDGGRIEVNPPLWRGLWPEDIGVPISPYDLGEGVVSEFLRVSQHSISRYISKLNEGYRA